MNGSCSGREDGADVFTVVDAVLVAEDDPGTAIMLAEGAEGLLLPKVLEVEVVELFHRCLGKSLIVILNMMYVLCTSGTLFSS